MFRAKHSGVSNPSLGLSYSASAIVGSLSSFIFILIMAFYSLVRIYPYLVWCFNTFYAVLLLAWVNRMTAVAGTRFTNPN